MAGCEPGPREHGFNVCGTEGSETIFIRPGDFPPGSIVFIYVGAGDDTVCLAPDTGVTVILYTGEGSDKIAWNCEAAARRAPRSASNSASNLGPTKLVAFGEGGNDLLVGGEAVDRLVGGSGTDVLRGFAGNDRLSGGAAADRLSGGSGDDRMKGGPGRDSCAGGGGSDTKKSC